MEERDLVVRERLARERADESRFLAAALSPAFADLNAKSAGWGKTARCRKVGVVLCGGNVDLGTLWKSYGL